MGIAWSKEQSKSEKQTIQVEGGTIIIATESTFSKEQNRQVKFLFTNMDINKLGNQIIQSKFLLCKKCSGFLFPPIVCVAEIGNVCGNCSYKYERKVLNVDMNLIMKDFILPCIYVNNGCPEKIKFHSFLAHQRICQYRYYECPFGCDFSNKCSLLLKHLQNQHRKDIVELINGVASIDIYFGPTSCKTVDKILLSSCDLFFVKFLTNEPLKSLQCGVFYANKNSICEEFTYEITCVESLILPYELKSDVFRDLPTWDESMANCFLQIPYAFIEHFGYKTINVEIVIAKKDEEEEVSDVGFDATGRLNDDVPLGTWFQPHP